MNQVLVKALKEICLEENINLVSFSKDWIFKLEKNNKVQYITGFKFPNNVMSTAEICNDKVGLCTVLNHYDIPCVTHIPVFETDFSNIPKSYFEKLLAESGKVVVKENKGTCGRNIFICSTLSDILNNITNLFKTEHVVALSPYYKINVEYRIIMLNHKPEIIYGKKIKSVVGNGYSNIKDLCNAQNISTEFLDETFLNYIPKKEEKAYLSKFHNLSKYGEYFDVEDEDIIFKLTKIAKKATTSMDLNFCSVDIVDTKEGLKILEINSGVMAEKYGENVNYEKVKTLYKKAILSCFM